jgi:hypothetical protein
LNKSVWLFIGKVIEIKNSNLLESEKAEMIANLIVLSSSDMRLKL